jgi:CheY-like chemotaxis protein
VPVIIVTVVDEREVGLALGAVDYFLKPVDREGLLSRVSRYVGTAQPARKPIRVLAVDDEPASLDLVAAALEPAGFQVSRATTGRAALELADRDPFDLVICDLIMPELDGWDVVAGLRSNERTRNVPILILTAHELTQTERDRLNGQVLGIVAKGADAVAGLRAWLAHVAPKRSAVGVAGPLPR